MPFVSIAWRDGGPQLNAAPPACFKDLNLGDVVDAACADYEVLRTETLGRQKSCTVRASAQTIAAKGLDVDCTALPLQKVFVALCGHEQEGC